jgi:hypothetical protein
MAVWISTPCGDAPPDRALAVAPADTAVAVAVRYREAEPMITVVEQEFPRRLEPPAPDQRWMRPCTPNYAKHNLGTPSIDLLLGLVKAFTMYTFVKLRKRPDDLEGEPMPELEKASGYENSAPSIDREEAIPNYETPSEPGEMS